jgi:Zn-dependent metalloprotease
MEEYQGMFGFTSRLTGVVLASGIILLSTGVAHAIAPLAERPSLPKLPVAAPGIETPASAPALHGLLQKANQDPNTYLRIDPATGSLLNWMGKLSAPAAGSAESVATAFVAGQLKLPVSTGNSLTAQGHALVQTKALTTNGTTHVTFAHHYNGIPVRGEEVLVHVLSGGAVSSVNGNYHALPASTAAGLDNAAAIAKAQATVGTSALRGNSTATTVWVPVNGQLVLAHEVMVPSEQPLGDFKVLIRADNGSVLGGQNLICAATTGTGSIYERHPLHSAPKNVTLLSLDRFSMSLSGSFAKIYNAKGTGATSLTRKYVYAPDNTHFDEVMVYFHLTKVHDYFKTLGFHLRDKPIKATVHYGTNYDNAFFSPSSDSLAFGDGNQLNDLAKEDTVVYHEYTHAVSQSIVSLDGEEGGGMNEGYSDYFAGTMTNDPAIGVYIMKKLNRPWLRNMTNTKHYPEDITHEVHDDGEIWGGVCWDLRKALGAQVADVLIHKSRYHLGSNTNFVGGLEGALASDRESFGGSHLDKIKEVFSARGIKSQAASAGSQLRVLNRLDNYNTLFGAQ